MTRPPLRKLSQAARRSPGVIPAPLDRKPAHARRVGIDEHAMIGHTQGKSASAHIHTMSLGCPSAKLVSKERNGTTRTTPTKRVSAVGPPLRCAAGLKVPASAAGTAPRCQNTQQSQRPMPLPPVVALSSVQEVNREVLTLTAKGPPQWTSRAAGLPRPRPLPQERPALLQQV